MISGCTIRPRPQLLRIWTAGEIATRCLGTLHSRGAELINVALVVTLDSPKLGPYRADIAGSVAKLLKLPPECIGLGFKTSEGLAPNHVQARATVLVRVR